MAHQRPQVGTGVIIKKEGKVLLGKRIGSHAKGSWAFTGGHLEFGETFEDCARRETLEEAGIEITNIRPVACTNDIFEKAQKHYVTVFMTADYLRGDVRVMETDKWEEWRWFVWDALPEPLMVPIVNLLKQGYSPF